MLCQPLWALGLSASLVLTGCYKTVRVVQQTQAPDVYRSASVETLEKLISDRDAAIKTLNASVLVTATTGGGKTGKVTEYISLKGYIFVRKPSDLRVLLQAPLVGSRALDMVSDATHFTLMRAQLHGPNIWSTGSNTITTPSKNGLENLRPPVFFDSLLVPGIKPEEYVLLAESSRVIQPDKRGKPAIEEPDYDLSIGVPADGANSKILKTRRVIHINRINMLPFQQDIFDDRGRVVTSATYDKYQEFNGQQFPLEIVIRRPLDQYQLKIEVTKLELNGKLEDDQFKIDIPAGVQVQQMP